MGIRQVNLFSEFECSVLKIWSSSTDFDNFEENWSIDAKNGLNAHAYNIKIEILLFIVHFSAIK